MGSLTILLVEDNPADVTLVKEALSESGLHYNFVVAEDGQNAASIVNRLGADMSCPALAIVDLNVPKIDGLDLIRLIKANAACSGLPILVTTSSKSPRDIKFVEEMGAKYFHKPIDWSEYMQLAQVVTGMLAQRNALEAQ